MKKRLLSLPLALALCVGLFAVPALADGPDRMGAATTFVPGIGFIDADGALWLWGNNHLGQLGIGTLGGTTVPIKVMEDVVAFSGTGAHTAAIKTDGSLWTWGDNTYGQLGNGGQGNSFSYDGETGELIRTRQNLPLKIMDNVAAVNCGNMRTVILKTDGTVWTCGYNGYGQLGNGGVGNAKDRDGHIYQTVPVQIMDNVAAISCGAGATAAAIKTDGSLWMWGENGYGELGSKVWNAEYKVHDRVLNIYQTVPIKVMDDVAAVSCAYQHTAAIKTDGSLWNWGIDCAPYPKSFTPPTKLMDDVIAIDCSSQGFSAVKSDGSLWTWGINTYGQLGNGGVGDATGVYVDLYQTVPVKIMDNVVAVSHADYRSAALKSDGTLWTWGRSDNGELGIGDVWNAEVLFGTPVQNLPAKLTDNAKLPVGPTLQIAYPSTQTVGVNSWEEELQFYAIKDKNGNLTNYVKLRDLANLLNTTAAEFQVGWDGSVVITTRTPYTPNGSEGNTPFSGARIYQKNTAITKVNGEPVDLDAFVLTDDQGGGYTYYKLRDLGRALNFNVGWSGDRGVFIEAHKPYDPND